MNKVFMYKFPLYLLEVLTKIYSSFHISTHDGLSRKIIEKITYKAKSLLFISIEFSNIFDLILSKHLDE